MFGEKSIFGFRKTQIDEKGRIFMPKFTYAERKDEIAVSEVSNTLLKLYNLKTLTTKVQVLRYKAIVEQKEEELSNIENTLERIYASIIATTAIDAQRRVLIPKEVSTRQNYDGYVVLQGASDHLRVYNSDASYEEYKKKYLY